MFDPSSVAAYSANIPLIQRQVNSRLPKRLQLTQNEVREYRQSNPVVQLFRKRLKKGPRQIVYAKRINDCWHIDTAYLDEAGKTKLFLVAVDVLSRRKIVEEIPRCTSNAVATVLEQIFTEHGQPNMLCSDLGPEFVGSATVKLMASRQISHAFLRDANVKASLSERAIRDLKSVVEQYKATTGKETFTDVLPTLVANMNKRPCRTLPNQLAPADINEENELQVSDHYASRWKDMSKHRFNYMLNDKVRIQQMTGTFRKSSLPFGWSSMIYKITDRHPSRPPTYTLSSDLDGQPLLGKTD